VYHIITNTIILNAGLDENQLAIEPKEKDFMRLAKLITTNECQDVVVKLKLTHVEWEDILSKTTYDSLAKRFLAFCYWKNKMAKNLETPTYQQLSDAFKSIKVKQKHPLCQVGNNCNHMQQFNCILGNNCSHI
jgi:hypothetical protein